MKLIFNNQKPYERENEVNSTEYSTDRVGCWCYVTALHSDSLTVDLENSNGFKFHYVPVASREWVSKDGGAGERDLPPVGSRVFVMMPTGTIQGGFVLCSGYSLNSVNEKSDFRAKSQSDIDTFNTTKKSILNSGWTYEEDRTNGDLELKDEDENIDVVISPKDDSKIEITAFDTVIKIDKDGMTINKTKKITLEGDEIEVKGKVTISGSSLQCDETGSGSGQGCFCGLPYCAFTGAPQSTNQVMGV